MIAVEGALIGGPRRSWFDAHGQTTPTAAGVVDCLLGGMSNTTRDRALTTALVRAWPGLPAHVHAGRHLHRRIIHHLHQQGVRQFLNIGSGIAHLGATHEVLTRLDDTTTVVYIDVDPVAVALNQTLLRKHQRAYAVHGDLSDPDSIVNDRTVTAAVDLGKPVALLLCGVLHHLPTPPALASVIGRLLDGFVAGSYLAVSHLVTGDALPDPRRVEDLYARTPTPLYLRPVDELAAALGGVTRLDMLEPGLVPAHEWRPNPTDPDLPEAPALYTTVGRLDRSAAPPPPVAAPGFPRAAPAGAVTRPTGTGTAQVTSRPSPTYA